MKQTVAWLVVVVVLAGLMVSALASETVGQSPMSVSLSKIDTLLTFDGTTAKCSGTVQGLSGTTGITATYTLQRKETNGTYTTLKTWANLSASGTTLRFSDTYTITKGYTYRLSVTANVTRNGTTETVSSSVENTP